MQINFAKHKFPSIRVRLGFRGKPIDLKILRNYIVIIFGAGVTRLINFFTSILLARWLGPKGFGEFSVFFSLLVTFGTATTFIDSTYVRYASTSSLLEQKSYLRGSVILKVIFSSLFVLTAYPIAWFLSRYIFQKPELETSAFIGILCGSFLNLLAMKASTYQVNEDFPRYTALNALFYGMIFFILIAVFISKITLNTQGVYIIYLISSLLVGVISFLKLYSAIKPLYIEKNILRKIFSFSKWLLAANITYIIFQRLDVLILARFANLEALGQYGAALRIVVIASLMTGTLSSLLLPRASRINGSLTALKSYLMHTFLIFVLLTLVIGMLWLATPVIVQKLFGEVYKPAASLARIILIGTALIGLYTPLSQLFLAEDTPQKMFYLGLIKLCVILGLSLLLVPTFGPWGAAWAMTTSEFAALIFTFITLRSSVKNIFCQK